MYLVNDFSTFERFTKRRAEEIYMRTGRTSQLSGIILSPVRNHLVKEIARSLDYWHTRSGDFFDLYWAGFSLYGDDILPGRHESHNIITSMAIAHQLDRHYFLNRPSQRVGINHKEFSRFVDDLNHRLSIAHRHNKHSVRTTTSGDHLYYPGGTELLLIDVDCTPTPIRNTRIRYESSVWINLDKLSAIKPQGNIQTLIEDIRRYSSTEINDIYVKEWLNQSGYVENENASSLSWRSACYALWRLGVLASDVFSLTGTIGQIIN